MPVTIEYFKRLTADQTHQAKQWTRITNISDRVQEKNYVVAEIATKRMKSHTITNML
jgi:hypothetical protein